MSVRFGGTIADFTSTPGGVVQAGSPFPAYYDKGVTPAALTDPNSTPVNAAIGNQITSNAAGYFEVDAPDGTKVLYTPDGRGGWVAIPPRADLAFTRLPASATPDGYISIVSGGQAVWAPQPGTGASQVAADNITGGTAAARAWTVGTPAQRLASILVRNGGSLLVTTDGRLWLPDGSTADSALAQALLGYEWPAETGIRWGIRSPDGSSPLYVDEGGVVRPWAIALPSASVDVAQLTALLSALVGQVLAPESGFAWGVRGDNGAVPLGVRASGRTYVYGLDVGAGGVTGIATGSGGSTTAAAGIAVVSGVTPNRQVAYVELAGGKRTVLTTTGDNHSAAVLADGRVLFYSGTALQVTRPGSGLVVPAESTTDVSAYGDSITQGVGASNAATMSWPSKLQAKLGNGVVVANEGLGGQTATNVAARHGSMRSTVVAAVTIPADTSAVALTLTLDPVFSGNLPQSKPATIAGVAGTLTRTGSDATPVSPSSNYTFARMTAGAATPVAAGAGVVFDGETTGRTRTQIYAGGRNDVRYGLGIEATKAAWAAFWTDRDGGSVSYAKRKLILGVTDKTTETAGDLALINALNAYGVTTYGRYFVDLNAYLRTAQALTDAGITATSDDLADIAAGLIPRSLHNGDPGEGGLHFNDAAYDLFARQIKARFVELGWSA